MMIFHYIRHRKEKEMEPLVLTPKYLSKEIAERAVHSISPVIQNMRDLLSREMCYVVILVPSMKNGHAERKGGFSDSQIEPFVLYKEKLGDMSKWPRKFDEIALNHALLLWQGRFDERTDCLPHLLFPGDSPFWGGVKRSGIVVSCCGFQPWFSKMFAGMIADMCISLSYHAWMKSPERIAINKGPIRSFLE